MTPEEFESSALDLQHRAEAAAAAELVDPELSPWAEYLDVWAQADFITLLTINYLFYARGYEKLLNLNGRTATREGGLLTKLGLKARPVTELEDWVVNLQAAAAEVTKRGTTNFKGGREYIHLSRQPKLIALWVQDYFWYKNSFEEMMNLTEASLAAERENLEKMKTIIEEMADTTQKMVETLKTHDDLENS